MPIFRKYSYMIGFIFLVFMLDLQICRAQERNPGTEAAAFQKEVKDNCGRENIGSWLAGFFGRYISNVDGSQCPSSPSCSSYSVKAFKKHGFFVGWVMTVDRLLHEADESSVSPVVYFRGRRLILDPVENNDFWWFDEKTEEWD